MSEEEKDFYAKLEYERIINEQARKWAVKLIGARYSTKFKVFLLASAEKRRVPYHNVVGGPTVHICMHGFDLVRDRKIFGDALRSGIKLVPRMYVNSELELRSVLLQRDAESKKYSKVLFGNIDEVMPTILPEYRTKVELKYVVKVTDNKTKKSIAIEFDKPITHLNTIIRELRIQLGREVLSPEEYLNMEDDDTILPAIPNENGQQPPQTEKAD
jgi:hypothetical protein